MRLRRTNRRSDGGIDAGKFRDRKGRNFIILIFVYELTPPQTIATLCGCVCIYILRYMSQVVAAKRIVLCMQVFFVTVGGEGFPLRPGSLRKDLYTTGRPCRLCRKSQPGCLWLAWLARRNSPVTDNSVYPLLGVLPKMLTMEGLAMDLQACRYFSVKETAHRTFCWLVSYAKKFFDIARVLTNVHQSPTDNRDVPVVSCSCFT